MKANLILFEDGEQHCKSWYRIYAYEKYINVILSLYIAIVNFILQEVFDGKYFHVKFFNKIQFIRDGQEQKHQKRRW